MVRIIRTNARPRLSLRSRCIDGSRCCVGPRGCACPQPGPSGLAAPSKSTSGGPTLARSGACRSRFDGAPRSRGRKASNSEELVVRAAATAGARFSGKAPTWPSPKGRVPLRARAGSGPLRNSEFDAFVPRRRPPPSNRNPRKLMLAGAEMQDARERACSQPGSSGLASLSKPTDDSPPFGTIERVPIAVRRRRAALVRESAVGSRTGVRRQAGKLKPGAIRNGKRPGGRDPGRRRGRWGRRLA